MHAHSPACICSGVGQFHVLPLYASHVFCKTVNRAYDSKSCLWDTCTRRTPQPSGTCAQRHTIPEHLIQQPNRPCNSALPACIPVSCVFPAPSLPASDLPVQFRVICLQGADFCRQVLQLLLSLLPACPRCEQGSAAQILFCTMPL